MSLKGIEVKLIREELQLTQQQLADKLDVNIRTVQKWEADETKIRRSTELMIRNLRNKVVESSGSYNNELIGLLSKEGVTFQDNEVLDWLYFNMKRLREDNNYFNLMIKDIEREGVKRLIEESGFKMIYSKKD